MLTVSTRLVPASCFCNLLPLLQLPFQKPFPMPIHPPCREPYQFCFPIPAAPYHSVINPLGFLILASQPSTALSLELPLAAHHLITPAASFCFNQAITSSAYLKNHSSQQQSCFCNSQYPWRLLTQFKSITIPCSVL